MEYLLILAGLVLFSPDLPGSAQSLSESEQERITESVEDAIAEAIARQQAGLDVAPIPITVNPTTYWPPYGGINCNGDCEHVGPTYLGMLAKDWEYDGAACDTGIPRYSVIRFQPRYYNAPIDLTCIDGGNPDNIKITDEGVVRLDWMTDVPIWRADYPATLYLPGMEIPPIELPVHPTVEIPPSELPAPSPLSLPHQPNFICPILSCDSVIQTVHDDHYGIDLATPTFSSAHAPAPGIVEFAGLDKGCGGSIVIDHGDGWTTRMCHLISVDVATGMHVVAGQALGTVGASGLSNGQHLHIEAVYDGLPRIFTRLIASVPAVAL